MTEQLFRTQMFLQSLAGDEELARELLAAFMEDSPKRSASLGEALDAGDANEASRLAHSLKGMCGVVRSDDLVTLALNMEHAAKNGDLEKTRKQHTKFVETLKLVHAEINTYLDN